MDIFDDMLAGVGLTLKDYLRYGETCGYPSLQNGTRLFVHDIRRVAIRAAIAMGKEGDMIVSSFSTLSSPELDEFDTTYTAYKPHAILFLYHVICAFFCL